MEFRTRHELEAGLASILEAPKDEGRVHLIVRRPAVDTREVLEVASLDTELGLIGDTWPTRGSSRTRDGRAHPDMQLTIMNARVIALLAGGIEQWPLAGDQIYVDLDVGTDNLPAGTRLVFGSALVEITKQLHTGCKKFSARFGIEALKFVSSAEGRRLNLRGVYARVVRAGAVRVGDIARRLGLEDKSSPSTRRRRTNSCAGGRTGEFSRPR